MDTLPRGLTGALRAFCRSISPEQPRFIRSKPPASARPSQCFDNVAHQISKKGGSLAYGWVIWHLEGVYFEAEHHGIWKSPSNEFLDVSPQLNAYPKILFLPDPAAVYDPKAFRSNRIAPDSKNPKVIEVVRLLNERNAVLDACRVRGLLAPDWEAQIKANQLLMRAQLLLSSLP